MEYMDSFDKLCDGNWIFSEDCGDQLMTSMGLRKNRIDKAPTGIMDEWKI
jgi:hypothetical protein